MNMDDNLFRFFGQFLVSTHQLELETGQFVIDGKKQYLHKWLKLNGLSLIKVVKVGLKGSDVSTVKLTHLVTLTDAMDLKVLKQKKIHELDALLNDKSLSLICTSRTFQSFNAAVKVWITIDGRSTEENAPSTQHLHRTQPLSPGRRPSRLLALWPTR